MVRLGVCNFILIFKSISQVFLIYSQVKEFYSVSPDLQPCFSTRDDVDSQGSYSKLIWVRLVLTRTLLIVTNGNGSWYLVGRDQRCC